MTVRVLLLVLALGFAAPAVLMAEPPLNLALSGAGIALAVLVLASERRRSAADKRRRWRLGRGRRSAELEVQLEDVLGRVEQQTQAIAELTNLVRGFGERLTQHAEAVDARLATLEAGRAADLEQRRRRTSQSARLRSVNEHLEHEMRELQRVLASTEQA
jgi:DNA anti-recombination protein RmuC